MLKHTYPLRITYVRPIWSTYCGATARSPARLAQCSSCRFYSPPPAGRQGFFSQFISNIKSEMQKNREMKENIKKFREEAKKLEQSETLQMARKKFKLIEAQTERSTDKLKHTLDNVRTQVQQSRLGKELSQRAKRVSDTLVAKSERLSQSKAFQKITGELEQRDMSRRVYRSPTKLRKRQELAAHAAQQRKPLQINKEATGVELHKDYLFARSWEKFKNNNPYLNKLLDWKNQYEESNNLLVRSTRLISDKVGDAMRAFFAANELSETMTQICKLDSSFSQQQFLRECETDIIPNVLEAILRGDLEVLEDWCFEGIYKMLAQPIESAQKLGYYFDSRIMDVSALDLVMGKMMDAGPALVITFQSQQTMCLRDKKTHAVIEGDPHKVMLVTYVWVMCRDPQELNPKAAWRLIELSALSKELML